MVNAQNVMKDFYQIVIFVFQYVGMVQLIQQKKNVMFKVELDALIVKYKMVMFVVNYTFQHVRHVIKSVLNVQVQIGSIQFVNHALMGITMQKINADYVIQIVLIANCNQIYGQQYIISKISYIMLPI
ncbi:unnamed protein product [Paramecium primaurelia]|uniref:Transmembrane protein n=1 Tax=Paramecium primaurelia TaxID=5886 RepID=A0A8S1QBE1_PARPR|nr:unnamed protein product [Paramecium primaurelia]